MEDTLSVSLMLHVSLVAIGGMVAAIFLVAWAAFGRPRHALIWAVAFATATVAWGIDLIQLGHSTPAGNAVHLILQGQAIALVAFGFRRRSGRFVRNRWLVTAASIQGLATLGLVIANAPKALVAAPLAILGVGMFALAGRALTGRRRDERLAERIAAAVLNLLALTCAGVLVPIARAAAGRTAGLAMFMEVWALLLPSLVMGIGLFTTFLMTADLADRTRRLAGLDMLTGLLNRRGFEEAATALMGSMRRNGRAMTLVLIDIDRFKAINDRFGHPAGDRLICAFADCLRQHSQRRDVLARLGGEEFAIIMADTDAETALAAVETLRLAIPGHPFDLGEPFVMTASFGLTGLKPEDERLGAALERADAALYRSKEEGRDRATLTA